MVWLGGRFYCRYGTENSQRHLDESRTERERIRRTRSVDHAWPGIPVKEERIPGIENREYSERSGSTGRREN